MVVLLLVVVVVEGAVVVEVGSVDGPENDVEVGSAGVAVVSLVLHAVPASATASTMAVALLLSNRQT